MYAKCGSVAEAHCIFDTILQPDVFLWNALLLGYAQNGGGIPALELFSAMKASGCIPDAVSYVAALKACTSLEENGVCLELGRKIHSEVGCHLNQYVQTTLIDMYAKGGSMVEARRVFNGIQQLDLVSWNALILGYAQNGEGFVSLDLISRMRALGFVPNHVTHIASIKACISFAVDEDGRRVCLSRGREIHLDMGWPLNHSIQNTLIDMYAKCGCMAEARSLFDRIQRPNVVSWNALLLGYANNGEGDAALRLFYSIKAHGCTPDRITYVAVFKACPSIAHGDGLQRGRDIHQEMMNYRSDHYVQTTLIDMYAKCGSMVEARLVFDSIQHPNVVSWSALMLGYAENGDGRAALALFSRMKALGCVPSSVTYIAALKACASIGALAFGRKLHYQIRNFTTRLTTCLVHFYARCGSIAEARSVVDIHSSNARHVPTWNALLAGYGGIGDTGSMFTVFEEMKDAGLPPDAVTFLCLLLSCSHAGMVDKAREHLQAMHRDYGITPTVMHYNCIVDALGRGNQLSEAIRVLRKMPCSPDVITWSTLLNACWKWKNAELGRLAFQSMDKQQTSSHVLMAHVFAHEVLFGNISDSHGLVYQP